MTKKEINKIEKQLKSLEVADAIVNSVNLIQTALGDKPNTMVIDLIDLKRDIIIKDYLIKNIK